MPSDDKRLECTVSGCGKLFNRKEHLNRHLKTHNALRSYQCPVCSRRYNRSDVLKRHVENHHVQSRPSPLVVPCMSCYEKELACDNSTPCQPCVVSSNQCNRLATDQRTGDQENAVVEGENSSRNSIANSHIPPSEKQSMNNFDAGLFGNNDQHNWISEGPWSIPYLAAGNAEPFSANADNHYVLNYLGGPMDGGIAGSQQGSQTHFRGEPLDNSFQTKMNTNMIDPTITCDSSSPLQILPTSGTLVSSPKGHDSLGKSLRSYLNKSPISINNVIQKFFAKVSSHWPILHAPTFNVASTSGTLLGAMSMLVSWVEGGEEHKVLAPLVFKEIIETLLNLNMSTSDSLQQNSLQKLQSLLLCVVYCCYCRTTHELLTKAVQLNSILISQCRQIGVFDGQQLDDDPECCPFSFWRSQEEVHRLAYAVLRVDAYLSILVDHPPSVRFQEINVPLPKSDRLWTAANEDERRKLQWSEPAGREKARFSLMMRDALDNKLRHCLPLHLTEEDYHICICSLQVGVWEAGQKAHGTASDELFTESVPRDHLQTWRDQISLWRQSVENDIHHFNEVFTNNPSTMTGCVFRTSSLILCHLSSLNLHAPLRFLKAQSHKREITAKENSRLHEWAAGSCARIAVWHAAQICRLVQQESTTSRLLLDPLASHSFTDSIITTYFYAQCTQTCAICTNTNPEISVDLLNTTNEDSKLTQWIENGVGSAVWGPNEIPVCKCQIARLAKHFGEMLRGQTDVDRKLLLFLEELEKK